MDVFDIILSVKARYCYFLQFSLALLTECIKCGDLYNLIPFCVDPHRNAACKGEYVQHFTTKRESSHLIAVAASCISAFSQLLGCFLKIKRIAFFDDDFKRERVFYIKSGNKERAQGKDYKGFFPFSHLFKSFLLLYLSLKGLAC